MPDLDCRTCGACCTDQLVLILPGDCVPVLMRDGPKMRTQDGRCIALHGRVRIDPTCSIYEQRPDICRKMEAGSWACLEIRRNWGMT